MSTDLRGPIRGILTRTSYEPPPNMDFESWERDGELLQRIEGSHMWWLGDWCNFGEAHYGEKYAQALEATSYSYQTLQNAAWVARKIEISSRLEIVPWSFHQEVVPLGEPAEMREFLEKAHANGWTRNELRAEVKRHKRRTRNAAIAEEVFAAEEDSRLVPVIYADPPWRYDFAPSDSRAIENQYPTMELEDICAEDPNAGPDAVLFLWVTSPKVPEGLKVMEAWGFDYKTSMVWVKPQIGMGYYARGQHELLFIGARGELPVPEPENRPSSVIDARRTEHSAKPDLRPMIDAMYPDFWKREMFSRQPASGMWLVHGNEV